MRIFGIDPGSVRTGYGCIETSGSRSALVCSGAIVPPARSPFPLKLQVLYLTLADEVMQAGLGKFPTATRKLSELLV